MFSYFLYNLLKKSASKGFVNPNSKTELAKIINLLKERYDIRANFLELTTATIKRFTEKLNTLIATVRKTKGGRQMKQLMEQYKSTNYNFKITSNSRKRKAEDDLRDEIQKRKRLEDELERQ